jgi:hypothetical protein
VPDFRSGLGGPCRRRARSCRSLPAASPLGSP